MAFRKRSIVVSQSSEDSNIGASKVLRDDVPTGIRPSIQDSRPTTSTGSASLDDLLGGHAGLPLGQSLLIEEGGTTDFASALLRYYVAEGVMQNHQVHLIGVPERWALDLPGVVANDSGVRSQSVSTHEPEKEKMKIAWRYERLGDFSSGSRVPAKPNRIPHSTTFCKSQTVSPKRFCHGYDLTKRLTIIPEPPFNCIATPVSSDPSFTAILSTLRGQIQATSTSAIHRIVIPNLLSPVFYPPEACDPAVILPFLHGLRALLREFPKQVSTLISLPLSLYPRTGGLVRWLENLSDGVIELAPFPGGVDLDHSNPSLQTISMGATKAKSEDKAQGALRIHKTPVSTAQGSGSGAGDDMAFSLGRREFSVAKFHLPPIEGDQEGPTPEIREQSASKAAIDF